MNNFSLKNNSNIEDGVVKERGCTDILCLGVFIVFLVGMFSVTSFCFAEGNVSKYLAPVDHNWHICGYSEGFTDKPFLSFANSYTSPFDNSECVAKCDRCSRSVGHYCVPYMSGPKECSAIKDDLAAFKDAFEKALESNAAGKQVMDLYKSSNAIFICSAMAILFCFVYIYVMSYFAEQIAWTLIGIT